MKLKPYSGMSNSLSEGLVITAFWAEIQPFIQSVRFLAVDFSFLKIGILL